MKQIDFDYLFDADLALTVDYSTRNKVTIGDVLLWNLSS